MLSSSARRSGAAITDLAPPFEWAWPQVEARLQRMLAARGVSPDSADDICQEVAWRVMSRGVRYETADDLYPWAATVARRLSIDLHRRERRLAPVDPPDRPAPVDVAALVESRTRLQAVVEAMPHLSAGDREALTAPPPAAASRREAVRDAVRRHRARARLLALVDTAGAAVAWILSGGWVRRLAKPAGAVAVAAAPALVLALAVGRPASTPPPARSADAHEARVAVVAEPIAPRPAPAPSAGAVAAPRPAAAAAARVPRRDPRRRADVAVVPTTPDGAPVGRALVRDREPSDPDACVTVGPVTTFCADLSRSATDRLGL